MNWVGWADTLPWGQDTVSTVGDKMSRGWGGHSTPGQEACGGDKINQYTRTVEQIFIPISHGGSIWNLASNSLVVLRKRSLKMLNLSDLGQRSVNDHGLGLS